MDILSLINIIGDLELQVNLETKISNRTLFEGMPWFVSIFEKRRIFGSKIKFQGPPPYLDYFAK